MTDIETNYYIPWTFKVKFQPLPSENVCITGDCESLGNWSSKNILPMVKSGHNLWTLNVNIPAGKDVLYRYFTSTTNTSDNVPKTMIHRWESNIQCRRIKKGQQSNSVDNGYQEFEKIDVVEKLERGWLINDIVIQLFFDFKNAIKWTSEDCSSKIKYVKLRFKEEENINECEDFIFVSSVESDGKFVEQDPNGCVVNDNDIIVFLIRTFSFEKKCLTFEFSDETGNISVEGCTRSFVLENKSNESTGFIQVHISSSVSKIEGTLEVKYLIIHPLKDIDCSFKSSYAKYWDNSWTGLEIGHRGTGVSFGYSSENNAKWRENTIGSFKSAGKFGANLVEFDVQLTNDLVPVIYHDFYVLLEVRQETENINRMIQYPLSKLNYQQLKQSKIYHVKEIDKSFSFDNDDDDDYSPFPSLEEVLESIDLEVGFNIEIKHISQSQDGINQMDHSIDLNKYIDKILEVVLKYANRRYIVFSSFSSDICTMTRFKQNIFPVMLLTRSVNGESYEKKERIQAAINFAIGSDLLGIVAQADDLLEDNNLIKMILSSSLVLFCWGDKNNNAVNLKKLKEEGVHGIIFDRIYELGQKSKKKFFKEELF